MASSDPSPTPDKNRVNNGGVDNRQRTTHFIVPVGTTKMLKKTSAFNLKTAF